MDPHSFIARAEAQRWLGIAEKLLIGHDLVGSKTFAIRARESDPRLEAADQILAIVDTLLAGEKRVTGNNGIQQPDFYAILQLVRFVQDTDHIAGQFRRLAILLNPHQNRFPFSDQAFELVNDAWAVLSNPQQKSMYDLDIDFTQHQQQQMNHIGFNLEQHQHLQHHQPQQHHQHNFFSVNHMASEQELAESQHIFETRVQQQQHQQQHNFLSQTNPIRPVQLFQPQVQPFMWPPPPPTPPPPVAQSQPLPFWPQAPPAFQQFQQLQQQQRESVQQNANNGVIEEEIGTETGTEDVDESPTFWTPCPYCLYMYEYPRVYEDCTLRCCNCKRAFQAVPVPSPPNIIEDQEAYLCCWGFYPLGVSMPHLEKNNGDGNNNGMETNSDWKPFSPLYDVSNQVQVKLAKKNRYWAECVYIDDVTDDIFDGISEPSDDDDSDVEWGRTKKKKVKRMKKYPSHKKQATFVAKRNGISVPNVENSVPVQEDEGEPTVALAESSKTAVASNPRRQSGRVAKELGKLDLNVEFNNNEGEEPTRRMSAGTRGNGQGDEDNIGGIEFFEGLDEFLNSLPILSVVNDEKGKAA